MNMRAGSAAAYKDHSGEITTEKIAPIMLHAVRPHCFREPRYIVQAPYTNPPMTSKDRPELTFAPIIPDGRERDASKWEIMMRMITRIKGSSIRFNLLFLMVLG
jgi:hypothetical protein